MKTVAFHTLGCKVNQYDSQAMLELFEQAGYQPGDFDQPCDVYVINTCTVTGTGDKKSLQAVRRARRLNPAADIIVCGCMAQRDGEKLLADTDARLILGTARRAEIVARLAQAGYREIVLTGIHLTSYGRDLKNGDTLLSVIRAVHDIAGVERIRLGSLEPVIATADFARALGEMPKLCPQFHLALQSGCDSVLRRMRRRYDTAAFRESAQALRAVFPDCALTTDVMSGFPGETDAEHRQSLDFCREMRFARMHVFPYSEREGTAAATMPDPVPRHIREERARELIALGAGMAEDYRRAQLGTVRRVLFEQCAEGVSVGYTPEYMRCETLGTVCGQTLPVRMTGLLPEGFSGEIVTD